MKLQQLIDDLTSLASENPENVNLDVVMYSDIEGNDVHHIHEVGYVADGDPATTIGIVIVPQHETAEGFGFQW